MKRRKPYVGHRRDQPVPAVRKGLRGPLPDWTAIRAELIARCAMRCEVCGGLLDAMHVHHRRPKAMGGTTRPDVHLLPNLLAVHPRCHDRLEGRTADPAAGRTWALAHGYLVEQQHDPAERPVYVPAHGWVLLTTGGTYEPVDDPTRGDS